MNTINTASGGKAQKTENAKNLYEKGYLVTKVLPGVVTVASAQAEFDAAVKTFPEYNQIVLDEHRVTTLGGFGVLNNPAASHNPFAVKYKGCRTKGVARPC